MGQLYAGSSNVFLPEMMQNEAQQLSTVIGCSSLCCQYLLAVHPHVASSRAARNANRLPTQTMSVCVCVCVCACVHVCGCV